MLFNMKHPLDLFKYCPKCGSEQFNIHNEKSKKCLNCDFVYYFNPSAATVAVILNPKGQILVCRRANEPAKGTLDLPGGFVDSFETGEEAVRREIKEETDLDAKDVRYLFSLPNLYMYSGFLVHTLDLFYLCKVDNTENLLGRDDISEAFFVDTHQLNIEEFGLQSIREGLSMLKKQNIL